MTSLPQLEYCTFAAINRSFIHAWLDGLAQKVFEELSRDAWWLNRSQQGFEGTTLDNTRLGIMQSVFRSAARRRISEERDKLERRGDELKTGWTEPLHDRSAYGF